MVRIPSEVSRAIDAARSLQTETLAGTLTPEQIARRSRPILAAFDKFCVGVDASARSKAVREALEDEPAPELKW